MTEGSRAVGVDLSDASTGCRSGDGCDACRSVETDDVGSMLVLTRLVDLLDPSAALGRGYSSWLCAGRACCGIDQCGFDRLVDLLDASIVGFDRLVDDLY
jgi:hypothetical protein